MVLNLQDDLDSPIKRDKINSIYKEYAANSPYLEYSEAQNVSSDIIGVPEAATVIESTETHTRTASIPVNLDKLNSCSLDIGADHILNVPITQAVVYGWYDNELGSYTNMLGDLTLEVAGKML